MKRNTVRITSALVGLAIGLASIPLAPKAGRKIAYSYVSHLAETKFEERFIEEAEAKLEDITSPTEWGRMIGEGAGGLVGDTLGRIGDDTLQDQRRKAGEFLGGKSGEKLGEALGGLAESLIDLGLDFVGGQSLEERRAEALKLITEYLQNLDRKGEIKVKVHQRETGWWRKDAYTIEYYIYGEKVIIIKNGKMRQIDPTSRFFRELMMKVGDGFF